MKNIFLLLALASCSFSAKAQTTGVYQHPNGNFEESWENNNEPGNHWTSFKNADGNLASTANNVVKVYRNTTKVTGYGGTGSAVKIKSKQSWGKNANGNLTTGRISMGSKTPESSDNYNRSVTGNDKFSLLFAGKPDRVEFDAIFKSGGSKAGRGNFILHGDVDYKDPEVTEQASYKYGQAKVYVQDTDSKWIHVGGDFTYTAGMTRPNKVYLLASFTTNETPGGSQNDEFTIDNVKFIYYNDLKTLTYGTGGDAQDLLAKAGKAVNNVVSIDASNLFYEKSKVAFKEKGQGANITKETYDPTTCILTIKVEANDISVNAQNYTTYEVKFKKPITISDDQDVSTTEDANAKVIMTRTFKKGWNTICLPFSTTAEALGAANVQELTDCTNDLINFKSVEGNIMEWNKPYLIYFNEEKAFTSENPFIFAGRVTDSNQSTGVTFSPITMRGNYKVNFSMKGYYGVVNQDGVQRIMSGGEEATLGPCRAYFEGNGKPLANGMLISFDGQTTGITSAELNAEGAAEDAPIYNLQGVRVNHLTKGVYIKGGKKIIVK